MQNIVGMATKTHLTHFFGDYEFSYLPAKEKKKYRNANEERNS